MAAFGRHYIAGMPGTRKESYPPSDHNGSGTYNNIAYSTNFTTYLGGSNYSTVPFFYNNTSNAIRPQYQLRYPQYQIGYVRVKNVQMMEIGPLVLRQSVVLIVHQLVKVVLGQLKVRTRLVLF